MEAKFSNRVKEVISLSREEALRLGHDYIGTEHLLLGVIREGEGGAIGLLKKLGIRSIYDLKEITYLGFTSVILNIFKIRKKINQTVEEIIKFNPDVYCPVDVRVCEFPLAFELGMLAIFKDEYAALEKVFCKVLFTLLS